MGILDLIFGKPKINSESTKSSGPSVLAVAELKKAIIERKEDKVRNIYPRCKALSNNAIALLPKIKDGVNKVKSRNIDKSTRGYEIAIQMKQKFSDRVPTIIDSIKPINEVNIKNIIMFHNSLNNAIVSVTKITSDNRYLFFFFNEEMKIFSKSMKELCNINDEIKQQIESKKDIFEEENKIHSFLSKYDSFQKEMKEILELDKKLKHEIEEDMKIKDYATDEMKKREQKYNELIKKIEGTEVTIEQLKKELTNYLALLERPIKKFKRTILNKQELRVIDELLSNPIETYVKAANKENELRKVIASLRESITKKTNEDDKKIIEKTVQAIDKLTQDSSINSAVQISELQKLLSLYNSEVQKIVDLNRESEKILHEFERKNKEIQKNAKLKEEIENKTNKTVEEIENLSEEFIESKVKLKS